MFLVCLLVRDLPENTQQVKIKKIVRGFKERTKYKVGKNTRSLCEKARPQVVRVVVSTCSAWEGALPELLKEVSCTEAASEEKTHLGPAGGTQPLWEIFWRILKKFKEVLPYEASIPFVCIYSKKTKTNSKKKHMHPYVHCQIIYNSQDVETA